MSIPKTLNHLTGCWTGVSKLWLAPTEPVRISEARAEVGTAIADDFLTVAYTWNENGPQNGLIVLGQDEESQALQAVWVDSWHQPSFMLCKGTPDAAGRIAVQGRYPAPEGPDWGWEIALESDGSDSFLIVMDNITPQGEHARAVEIALRRG